MRFLYKRIIKTLFKVLADRCTRCTMKDFSKSLKTVIHLMNVEMALILLEILGTKFLVLHRKNLYKFQPPTVYKKINFQ